MNPKVRMIKKVIEDQIKLFDAPFVNDCPEIKDTLHQMIHGTKATKSIKLYQYLMEAFLYPGEVTSRIWAITASRKSSRASIE